MPAGSGLRGNSGVSPRTRAKEVVGKNGSTERAACLRIRRACARLIRVARGVVHGWKDEDGTPLTQESLVAAVSEFDGDAMVEIAAPGAEPAAATEAAATAGDEPDHVGQVAVDAARRCVVRAAGDDVARGDGLADEVALGADGVGGFAAELLEAREVLAVEDLAIDPRRALEPHGHVAQAGVKVPLYGVKVANTAAKLHINLATHFFENLANGHLVFGVPSKCTVQIDKVQTPSPFVHPFTGHDRRVFAKGGGLVHVALFEANAVAVFEVNRRN
mgnify:CR=1 FL=1